MLLRVQVRSVFAPAGREEYLQFELDAAILNNCPASPEILATTAGCLGAGAAVRNTLEDIFAWPLLRPVRDTRLVSEVLWLAIFPGVPLALVA
jgi:hypothetical protein